MEVPVSNVGPIWHRDPTTTKSFVTLVKEEDPFEDRPRNVELNRMTAKAGARRTLRGTFGSGGEGGGTAWHVPEGMQGAASPTIPWLNRVKVLLQPLDIIIDKVSSRSVFVSPITQIAIASHLLSFCPACPGWLRMILDTWDTHRSHLVPRGLNLSENLEWRKPAW